MLENQRTKFKKARNCTTDVPTWLSIHVVLKKMPQLVPNVGKHSARKESQELYHFCGAKMDPWGGTENNSPVVQFLAFILLVNEIFENGGTEFSSLKAKKVV